MENYVTVQNFLLTYIVSISGFCFWLVKKNISLNKEIKKILLKK